MARTYSVDLSTGGHEILGVALMSGLGSISRSVSEVRSQSPAYGAYIEIPAVVELLDLVAAGAVPLQEVRDDLMGMGTEIAQDQEREVVPWLQEIREDARSQDQHQQKDTRWVYAVSSEDSPKVVKIGVASNIRRRIVSIQTSSPTKIHLRWSARGGLPLETHLHEKFHRRRMSGEWFDFRRVADPVKVISDAASAFLEKNERMTR